ncbi:MAG TPA: MFS transporter [Roseiarcus sp.]|nr:MFS transporter [Roseiarcus sp.]
MLAQALARRFSRLGLHYGWAVVAITFATTLVTAGAMGLPGALILPLSREFGWNTEQISSALALRILLYGLMAPFAASLIDRYGLRRVILSAVFLIAAGLLLALKMNQVWHLVLLWGVVVGLGTGLTALVTSAIVATRWFSERRGLVLGILTASSATGQLVFLPLAAWLEQRYGWRAALVPTLIGLAFAGAAVLLFMADRPSDVGLEPYGECGRSARAAPPVGALGVLGEISGSGAFWILAATFFVCGLSTNGLIQTHFIALCSDYNVGAVAAASTLAMMGMFDFVGTIGSGWLSDRYDNRALLFVYYGLRGLSLLYLPGSSFSIYGLSLFAVFYGLDWVATVPPTARLTAQVFGRERAGVVFGWIFAAHMVGASFAAYGAGYSRSVLQTYLPAFYAAGALCLVAASLVWLIEKRPATVAAAARAPA